MKVKPPRPVWPSACLAGLSQACQHAPSLPLGLHPSLAQIWAACTAVGLPHLQILGVVRLCMMQLLLAAVRRPPYPAARRLCHRHDACPQPWRAPTMCVAWDFLFSKHQKMDCYSMQQVAILQLVNAAAHLLILALLQEAHILAPAHVAGRQQRLQARRHAIQGDCPARKAKSADAS